MSEELKITIPVEPQNWVEEQARSYTAALQQCKVNSYSPPKLKIYTASTTDLAEMWLTLAGSWSEFTFTARWPRYTFQGIPQEPAFAMEFWQRDFEDIDRADILLCYSPDAGILRGALVEAGYALAYNKRVLAVGSSVSFGTWQYHPLVTRLRDLPEARRFLTFLQNTNPI